ncbi:hydrogenase expression/formation protein HypE [Thermobrachium celere]|uniref:[NiFe] hydrogenase metallocenter assembly protein HypE n=1 Tax=Thermobrachium celere DSM 8682 TaxID=941824 RepID=R7RRZ7_9CLOT|nr:hydrogenase expression/formation protein HypE [Thermobrachium celere]CDF58156.1 [NiFe] hydrogenase metallocenter assembly protein HypE [Thermobrachium celere DSM 8682]
MDEIITLSYGSGGKKTSQLIENLILPAFACNELNALSDGAILELDSNKFVFSTDSFVVSPYFFPGGDIGKLAVCGTVNDLAVCGAVPKFLSLSLIIEEGFKLEDLKKIINSIKETAEKCNVKVVTGDTKVVEKGKGDGIYINTSGIGVLTHEFLGKDKIAENDVVIVTGTVGDHGASIMAARNNLVDEFSVISDCAPIYELAQCILQYGNKVKIMRDPTRGGVATTLNEFVEGTEYSIEINEEDIPVSVKTNNLCEILGIDPLYSANEGKILAVVDYSIAESLINDLRNIELGKDAAIIGKVTKNFPSKVVLNTNLGGSRVLTKLTGAQLPRIC